MVVASAASSAFELKSAALTLVAVVLKTTDLARLSQALISGGTALRRNDFLATGLESLRWLGLDLDGDDT